MMTTFAESETARSQRHHTEPASRNSSSDSPTTKIDPDKSKNWLRRLSPVILAHKGAFLIALLFTFIALLIQVAVPYVTMLAIDEGLSSGKGSLILFIWVLFFLSAGRALFVFAYRYLLFRTAYTVEFDLRALIFKHITRLSFSFFDRVQSGQLISRANSDIRAVQRILVFGPFILTQITAFFITFGVMVTIHLPLAILCLLPLPFVYFIGIRMRRFMFPISWIVQARLADLATIVEENITGVRVVKSFAAERHQIGLFARAAERLRWAAVRSVDIRALYAPIMENLPRLATALVLLVGGYLIIKGQATFGALIAFSQYIIRLQAPFRMLGMLMMLSQRSSASAKRIFEILDERPEISDRPGAETLVDPGGEIAYKNVTFSYDGGPVVLSDLSLKIKPGENVAVVGRTGSGKTTLARLLTRFYEPTQGSIEIDGHDLRDLTLHSLRANIGVVLDEPILFSTSIRENIAYGRPDAGLEEIRAAAKTAGAQEFIDNLREGYDTVLGERGYTLSGGQRQRLSIARTLLIDPRILILDDATSSVDVHVEQEIHEALRATLRNRSTLIIAHRVSTISLADRVIVLENGRIIASGTHQELLSSEPRYLDILTRVENEKGRKKASREGRAALRTTRPEMMSDHMKPAFEEVP